MSSGSRAETRIGRALRVLAGIPLVLLSTFSGSAASAEDEVLAVLSWERPAAAPLAPFHGSATLLARDESFAVLALPVAAARTEGLVVVGPLRGDGAYFLFVTEDARSVRFAETVDVLHREGHTVLLWTPREEPRPTLTSAAPTGLEQLRRITRVPKPWPEPVEPALRAATPFAPAIESIVENVSEAEYVSVWQSLDDFETRYTYAPANDASAMWMYALLSSYGLQVDYFVYPQSGPKRNVIATHPGVLDPTKVVYLTGHFDCTSEDPENHAPGADDNGSGTAAVLEAARVLSGFEFQYTIKFAAFNGEEQGLNGSSAYVEHIHDQGEDVLGCINLDMVAYRGTDPAPADLVIYTNSASLPLATILRDAAEQYLPGQLEPKIQNQALGASDHASFWEWGYAAVLGIEEYAWGSDFCPWYHTSEDRIERYPTDYPTHVTKAAVAAAAHRAVPVTAVGAPLPSRTPVARLHPAFPNPSRGTTTFRLDLPVRNHVRLALYDVAGRPVRTLLTGPAAAGPHELVWSGRDDRGRPVAAGVYWVRLETEADVVTERVIRVR